MFGKKDSKVLFVEFSDPSCPFCHVASGKNPELNKQAGAQFTMEKDGGTYVPPVPEMKKLVDSGKAAYVWLYANGHGNGELATKALVLCEGKGKVLGST
jgi:protein-disulfide isomerase